MPTASVDGVTQSWEEYELIIQTLDAGAEFLEKCIPFLRKVALSSPLASGIYSEEAAQLLELAGEPLIDDACCYKE
jgi:hypothetical protein